MTTEVLRHEFRRENSKNYPILYIDISTAILAQKFKVIFLVQHINRWSQDFGVKIQSNFFNSRCQQVEPGFWRENSNNRVWAKQYGPWMHT